MYSLAESALDKIEDIMAEFGHEPQRCLAIIGEFIGEYRHARTTSKRCTCHPSDNPPKPCPHQYAYSDCKKHEHQTER